MAIPANLEALLLRTNPWLFQPSSWPEEWARMLPDPFVPRLLPEWDASFPADKVTLVVGPRQAGKSTLLWSALRDLGPEIVLINCEEPLLRQWCTSPALFLGDLAELLPEPRAIVIEEAQHLEQAGLFLKGLVDRKPGCPVLATGSSSFHLMSRTRESLAGRARRQRLLPFSLSEVTRDLQGRAPAVRTAGQRQRFERMLRIGGYPEVWLSEAPERLLGELVEGVVVRDASDLFRIDQPEAFRRVLGLMAGQAGNLVNLTEWAAICGASRKTVVRYVEILEEAHVVKLLRPWVSGKRAELTGRPKVFFVDNGIRNAVLGRFDPLDRRDDVGALWENWVYTEIAKHVSPLLDSVGFWRTRSGAEVDFVVTRGGQRIAVEVKAAAASRRVIGRSARSFIEAVRPDRFVMLHNGEPAEADLHGCAVQWAHPTTLGEILG